MSAKILFVCLGNICRSPLAEGIFLHMVRARGLQDRYQADSAGMGDWHVGQAPDPRSISAASKHGVPLPSVCRQVSASDFREFDLILAMDGNNYRDLNALCPADLKAKIRLMRDFDSDRESGRDVPDPYWSGPSEFDQVYAMLARCCAGLLDNLESGMLGSGDAAAA